MAPTRIPCALIRDLVRRLGGPAVVAREFGVTLEAVSMWALSKTGIPAAHHLALWRLAVERGLSWQPPGSEGWRLVRDEPTAASADDAAPQEFAQCSHSRDCTVPLDEAA